MIYFTAAAIDDTTICIYTGLPMVDVMSHGHITTQHPVLVINDSIHTAVFPTGPATARVTSNGH